MIFYGLIISEIIYRFLMGKFKMSNVFKSYLSFFLKIRCGEPNMYMQGFKCKVSNSISTTPLATPKPAVWCEGQPKKCTKGAKQLIGWNQKSGNNIKLEGFDQSGNHKSPGYNNKCGFSDGEFCEKFFIYFSFLFLLYEFL